MISFHELELNHELPVYVQIINHVKRQILIGEAVEDEALPSRREIATVLNVNPNTVQKAFKIMEEEGFVVPMKNAPSRIHLTEELTEEIRQEMTVGLVSEFVRKAKANKLSFRKVVELLNDLWEESEE